MLPRILLESTVLRSVGYHPQLFILELEYHGRRHRELRHYEAVPFWVPLELMAAPSKHRYYQERIRFSFRSKAIPVEQHLFAPPPRSGHIGLDPWPWAAQRRPVPTPPAEASVWERCMEALQADPRQWGEDVLRKVTESVTGGE